MFRYLSANVYMYIVCKNVYTFFVLVDIIVRYFMPIL